jgi:hypothetical protein
VLADLFLFIDEVPSHSFLYTEPILRETLRYPDIKHQRYHLGHTTPADQSSGAEANITEHDNEIGFPPLPCPGIKDYALQTLVLLVNELDCTK